MKHDAPAVQGHSPTVVVQVNGAGLSSGVYLYGLRTGDLINRETHPSN